MKIFLYCILLFLVGNSSFSQTQLEMNEAEHKKIIKADEELNQVYQAVLNEYESDTAFIKSLKASQRVWVQFRECRNENDVPGPRAGLLWKHTPDVLVNV